MRVFATALIQETDTFNPHKTNIALFRQGYLLEADQVEQRLAGTNTEVGGFYEYAVESGMDIVPGLCCWAVASGVLLDSVFEELAAKIIRGITSASPVDGILLALHGALVTESFPDGDGEILSRVRALVGPDMPIVATLDYHANLTKAMVENSNALVGFRTYPHVDFKETGYKVARDLHALIANPHEQPRPIVRKLPMLVPVEDAETSSGVSGYVISRLRELDKWLQVHQPSFFCTQPWLNIPEVGMALLMYASSDADFSWLGRECDELAKYIMEHKEEYFRRHPSIADVTSTIDSLEKPLIIVDSGDVTTGGGSGESTAILRALLEAEYEGNVSLNIVSPEAVAAMVQAGENVEISISVGTGGPGSFNVPVKVSGKVVKILRSQTTLSGPSIGGIAVDPGTRVYFRSGNIHCILFEHTTFLFDPSLLREIGIEPEAMDIIVQKSHKLFRAAYKDIAKTIVLVDSPGYTDANLRRLSFSSVSRPLYPLDSVDSSSVYSF